MSKKFLVTGGAGFIGSALIRHLIGATGHSVVNVDKLTYAGNRESLAAIADDPRYAFEQLDILDARGVGRVLAEHRPDLIVHLAAESHVDRSIDRPAEFIQTNIVGTYTLLELASAWHRELSSARQSAFRFVHVSTDEVYGDLPHPAEQGGRLPLFTENTPYAPSSPYSASKAASDHLVRAWHRSFGLPAIVTNCSNNYGPYQFPEKLVPLTILNAVEGKPLPVYGRGDHIRDWLYVEDHARALTLVALQGAVGQTYNIGGHNEKTNLEVVRAVCSNLEELLPAAANEALAAGRYADLIAFVDDRPGHDRRYASDAGKIAAELGWSPEETFAGGIRKTVQWYLDNPEWCRHVQDGTYQRERLGKRR